MHAGKPTDGFSFTGDGRDVGRLHRHSVFAQGGFPDLVAGLKATPGCLGVETAKTTSGKQVIFAWFEDKKAAIRWYSSAMHQQVMQSSGLPTNPDAPLAGVSNDSGPIMAIASLTPSQEPAAKKSKLPFSQIAIELYTPLPGGVVFGGRFAPASVRVAGLRDIAASAESVKK